MMTWRHGVVLVLLAQAPPQSQMERIPQFESDRAVSWKSVIPAHTESTLHRHDRYRAVIAIAGGDLTTVTAAGEATVTHYETGRAYWQAPMPPCVMHKDVNNTDETIEVVVVEVIRILIVLRILAAAVVEQAMAAAAGVVAGR